MGRALDDAQPLTRVDLLTWLETIALSYGRDCGVVALGDAAEQLGLLNNVSYFTSLR